MLGKLWTTARWIRHFIQTHPEYKHDSAVSTHINYDLVRAVEKITKGLERGKGLGVELLGRYGLDVSSASTPETLKAGKGMNPDSPKINGIQVSQDSRVR